MSIDYVKIPRDLIYDKQLGSKRILSYSSLLFHCWERKICDVTELSIYCGYSDNRHSYATIEKMNCLFQELSEKRYICIDRYSNKAFTFFSQPPKCSFGIIYKNEFEQIIEYRNEQKQYGSRINHANLLLLLSYIRLNMERQPGKPVMHYSMIKTISENIGLSTRSISRSMKILRDLSILYIESLPRFQDINGNWHTNVNIFVNINSANNATGYDWRKEAAAAKRNLLAVQREIIGGKNEN